MRLKILNAVSDPTLESRRKKFTGKITRRPVVCGRPLPSGHSRLVEESELSSDDRREISEAQRMGLIRVFAMGQGEISMIIAEAAPAPKPQRVVVAPAPAPAPPAPAPEPEELSEPEEPETPPEEEPSVEDLLGEEEEEEPTPEPSNEEAHLPDDFAERLESLKNDELRSILGLFGVPTTGKNKSALVESIVEEALDGDPVVVNKAVALLVAAEG
jgi:hypothetical protein